MKSFAMGDRVALYKAMEWNHGYWIQGEVTGIDTNGLHSRYTIIDKNGKWWHSHPEDMMLFNIDESTIDEMVSI